MPSVEKIKETTVIRRVDFPTIKTRRFSTTVNQKKNLARLIVRCVTVLHSSMKDYIEAKLLHDLKCFKHGNGLERFSRNLVVLLLNIYAVTKSI